MAGESKVRIDVVVTAEVPVAEYHAAETVRRVVAVEAVREAIQKAAGPLLLVASVVELEPAHADRFHADFGMPFDCGMPAPARVFSGGDWEYDHDGVTGSGRCVQQLVDFVRANGGDPARTWR
jgi:hypothetical protein